MSMRSYPQKTAKTKLFIVILCGIIFKTIKNNKDINKNKDFIIRKDILC